MRKSEIQERINNLLETRKWMEEEQDQEGLKKIDSYIDDLTEQLGEDYQPPSSDNDVFNHRKRDFHEATGVTREDIIDLQERLQKAIEEKHEDNVRVKSSMVVEIMMEQCSKKELAVLLLGAMKQNPLSMLMDLLK